MDLVEKLFNKRCPDGFRSGKPYKKVHILYAATGEHDYHLACIPTKYQYPLLNFRIAIVFEKLGLKPGECIHVLAGNHNYSYLLNFAAWYLGAYTSTGDVALDEDTVAGQV